MKKAIAFSLIISASAAFAQTRAAESFKPANNVRLINADMSIPKKRQKRSMSCSGS